MASEDEGIHSVHEICRIRTTSFAGTVCVLRGRLAVSVVEDSPHVSDSADLSVILRAAFHLRPSRERFSRS